MIPSLARKLDWRLIGISFFLFAIGLLTLASGDSDLFYRQLIWGVFAAILIFGLPAINIDRLLQHRWMVLGIYLFALLLLVITYFVAPVIHGTRSWIVLGDLQVQPSEFMKIALIVLLSSFFAVRHVVIAHLGIILTSFLYFLIPAVLILLQPDVGTVLVLFGIWFSYLLLSGLPWKHVLVAFLIFALLLVVAWNFGLLADHQKSRIIGLFNPGEDLLGINYSVAQSKIAIGSAGFLGKGFGQGTQVQMGFLPEAQTDFIFAAFVEEWGFLGGTILIAGFIYFLYRVLKIGIQSSNNFARFISLGVFAMLALHFVINMGSILGLLPVIGIGLPLISYGGSNLLTVAVLLGILQSVSKR